MLIRSAWARSLALVAFFAARSARAEGPVTSALSWVRLPGAEACITTAELGSRVEEHLGRPALVSPSVADVSIEARVVRSGGRYRATVGGTRRDGTAIGSRELTSSTADCRRLDDGLVLVIALMIDPNAVGPRRATPDPPTAAPVVTHEIVHERIVVREVEPARASSAPWIVQGALVGAASIARVPGVAPAGGLALRTGPSRLVAFELALGVVPLQTFEVGSRSVDYSLLEGGLAFCPAVALGSLTEVGGCLGMRLGAIRSQGNGFASNQSSDRGLADVAVGTRLTVSIAGPVFGLASATALVPLVRQETTMTDAGAVVVLDRRSAIGGEIGVGAGLRFSP